MLRLALGTALTVCGCTPHLEPNPRDREAEFPPVGPGSCDVEPVLSPAAFFADSGVLAADVPAAGSLIAVEGTPEALAFCVDVGCAWECCDNECWADSGCAYRLAVDARSEVCLGGTGFGCGGTDCSPYCEPLSMHPSRAYRFVGTVSYDLTRVRIHVGQICTQDE